MKLWIAGLAAAASVSAPARAEVVALSDAGFVVRVSAEVTASPQDAWKELITPAGWWMKEHTFSGDSANLYIDSQATGCFCEKLPAAKGAPVGQRPGSVEHMQIVFVDPGKALRMNGALGPLQSEALSGTLTITLKPVGGNTRILWEYVVGGYMRYKPAEIAPAVDKVLAEQLDSLASKLGPIAPRPAAKAPAGGRAGGKAGARAGPAQSKATAKPADDADEQKLDDQVDETLPVDVPDEPGAEEPKPAPAPTLAPTLAKPARAGKRQPKPDDEYVEPTR